jgi:hypothetical protein
MKVDYESIEELFRVQDIEGLISSGAPDDEYQPEVERIFAERSFAEKVIKHFG